MGWKGVPDFYNADRKKIKMGIIFHNGDRKSKWVAAQVCCRGESEEIFVWNDDVVVNDVVACNKVGDKATMFKRF